MNTIKNNAIKSLRHILPLIVLLILTALAAQANAQGCATPSFAPAQNFGAGDAYSVTTGDFNADGKLDLATANENTDNVSVLLGDGLGGFSAPTNFSTGDGPLSVTTGDFNSDGKLDLATANINSDNVSVLLNTCSPDTDGDGDGIADTADNCLLVSNADQLDTDGDGQGNACDSDDDGDGVTDANDAFPLNPNESVDTDSDGIGNNADPDDDNDGQTDADEIACGSDPLSAASRSLDTDGDNRPNCVDTDDDGDGVLDTADNCPLVVNPNQADFDLDGIGDTCDAQTGPPRNTEQCKNGGFMRFDFPRTFKNQGDCIQFVNTGR